MSRTGVMAWAPEPCIRCGKRFEVDSSVYRRQPKTCRACVGAQGGREKPADPVAMLRIQQILNKSTQAWADAPDPERQANASCPTCGAAAEHTIQDLADAHLRQETWRCLADGPRCRLTVRQVPLDTLPALINREEPAPMPTHQAPPVDQVDEDAPYRVEVTPKPRVCECGCEKEPKLGRRFASRSCVGKTTSANLVARNRELRASGVVLGGRKKSSPPPAGEQAPAQPDPPPAGEGNTPVPPPIADPLDKPKLCDCGCGRPCLGVRRWATNECNPVASPHAIAKAYLRKLTPAGRQALLDLIAAEERCSELGVR